MSTIIHEKCPVCTSTDLSLYLPIKDHSISKENFELYRCGNCTFTLTQNIPTQDTIGKYYASEDYISHSDTNEGLVNKLYHSVREIMLKRKWQLIQQLTPGKKLLDIGCGTGYFLKYMKDKKYEVVGVEEDPDARKIASNHTGNEVHPTSDFSAKRVGNDFDAITMWHVLEHVHDLNEYMANMHSILNDQGALVIAVPNCSSSDAAHYKSYWAAYDVPRHLWHFTPSTMEQLSMKHGFRIEKFKTLPFDSFYNAMLSEKYKNNKLFLISGFLFGFVSYLNSLFNVKKSSSVVYVLRKIENK